MTLRPLRDCSCILVLVVSAFARPLAADAPGLHFHRERPFDVEHIRLDLYVEIEQKFVRGRATIDGSALRDLSAIRLDAVDFREVAVKVKLGEKPFQDCKFENDEKSINILLPQALARGDNATLMIDYTLKNPKAGLSFFAPSEDEPEAPYLMWSQGQSITNRYWVPCYDHPNEMQTTEIVCTVARPYIAISNGVLVQTKDNADDTRTFHWKQNQPHVSYLMTLVLGEFASKTEAWRGKPVTYYVHPKHEDKIDNSFSNTVPMMEHFSELIGVPYPWDKYAQVCCYGFGGGMENTSATTLGEGTLHDDRAHLETSSDGLVAHELAHQWFGDLLTCKDWAHLWLNEGFASYFESIWEEKDLGYEHFEYDVYQKARRAISGGKDKPVVYYSYGDPDEQFDSRAYPKGAYILHMVRRRLGDEMFWNVMKTYTTNFSHKSVETSDFRKVIEEISGYSFGRFFYDWTERPGNPDVTVSYEWLGDERTAQIRVRQTQKADAFHFPLTLAFRVEPGRPDVEHTKLITEKDVTYQVALPFAPTRLRVDPGNAVLMELTREQPRRLWEAQLSDDPNPSARLEAVKYFAKAGTEEDIRLLAGRLTADSFWAVSAEIASALGDSDEPVARETLLAAVTLENPWVRAAVVEALAKLEGDAEAVAALENIVRNGDASYRVEAQAIESYAQAADEPDIELIESCLSRDSHREQIRSAAFRALARHGNGETLELLLTWTTPDKPMACRSAAIDAVARLMPDIEVDDDVRARVIDGIRALLRSKSTRMQFTALRTIEQLGERAFELRGDVEKLTTGGRSRVRRMAKSTLDRMKPPAEKKNESENWRGALEELRKQMQELQRRLEQVEGRRQAA